MMLYGKKIKIFCVVLLLASFLFTACCNKNGDENKSSTTQQETKEVFITKETQAEKTNTYGTEKISISTSKTEINTTVTNKSGDNEIYFDVAEDDINLISQATITALTSDNVSSEITSQKNQITPEPATDSDGWVTEWY